VKSPEVPADLPNIGVYQFDDFRLDAAKRLLHRRDGSSVPLTPRVFDTLLFLVHHAGVVLDKERLMEAVWPDSIVEENNLNKNISTLRRVFGEAPGSHRFIMTVPGRGYRFVAEVKRGSAATEPAAAESAAQSSTAADARPGNGAEAPSTKPPPAARDESAPDPLAKRSGTRRGAIAVAIAVLCLVAAAVIWWRAASSPAPPLAQPLAHQGIAVLPFENLSSDAADMFFAGGIQDDILTSVGRIKDLKVIARTSVMDYRGPRLAGKVREIGSALGVSHVLEGSVRRAGDRVVVSVALIDTRDERQVWSERFERPLIDTISLQGELAVEIARALHATLTPAEATVTAAKPTQNPEAYLRYLRGREMESSAADELVQPAIELYQHAIDLDPSFALARARLSLCASRLNYSEAPGDWKAKARVEAEEALRINPGLGEARLALTHCYLWGDGDYERALAELSRTAELLPNSAEVPLTAAFIYKRQNRFRNRLAALRRAETLDPRNRRVLGYLTTTFRWVRDWPEAIQAFDRYMAVAPEPPTVPWRWSRVHDEFRLSGDLNTLKKAIAQEANAPTAAARAWLEAARYDVAMFERNYAQAARYLAAASIEGFPDTGVPFVAHSKAFHEALVAVASNSDAAGKQQALEAALADAERRLGRIGSDKPRADLAVLYAFLGRKDEAIREGQRATELEGNPAGTIEKNDCAAALAMVYAQTGEAEKAIDLIEHLLTVPIDLQRGAVYNMTLTDLKWRWQWDPLRSHRRFQKLLAGREPKTVY
jgi:TolB-like protein/DNA-binding winged helix-turn-helix (wHTH) protein/Tfp pilus assembly protein PilF